MRYLKKNKKILLIISLLIIPLLLYQIYITNDFFKDNVKTIPKNGQIVITLDKDTTLNLKPSHSLEDNDGLNIHVLNKQEYPKLYGNWTVIFNTTGSSYLVITGMENTTYADLDNNITGELEVVQLRCGDKIVYSDKTTYSNIGMKIYPEKIIFSPYSCNETNYFTVKLLGCNKHKQKISFGNSFDIANNSCSGTDTTNLRIKDPDGIDNVQGSPSTLTINPIDAIDDSCSSNPSVSLTITCQKPGNYNARVTCDSCTVHAAVAEKTVLSCATPSANKFKIYYSASNVAAFDSNGYLFHKGSVNINQGALTPSANSFIVKNSGGTVVAYISSAGNLYLKGGLNENQGALTPSANSLVIKNSVGTDVAYIDSNGNMYLSKYDYENWIPTI